MKRNLFVLATLAGGSAALWASGASALPLPSLESITFSQAELYSYQTQTFYRGPRSEADTHYGQPASSGSAIGPVTEHSGFWDPGCQCTIPVQWQAQASGSGFSRADFGSLHIQADAAYQLLPYSQTFQGYNQDGTPYSVTELTPFYVGAVTTSYASFKDYISPWSADLPQGSTVYADLSATVDGGMTGGALGLDFALFDMTTAQLVDGVDYSTRTPGAISASVSRLAPLILGHDYQIRGWMQANINLPEAGCDDSLFGSIDDNGLRLKHTSCGQESVLVDAGNTAHFYISPTSSDYLLLSESGHDYGLPPSVAPEPATWASLVVGLFGLGAGLRRSRGATAVPA